MSAHWKGIELQIARILSGERVPVSGRTGVKGMESPDVSHPIWAIEIKHYGGARVPKWLISAMNQAKASLKAYHVAPVAIIHKKGTQVKDSLCVLPLSYLLTIQELLKEREEG